MNNCQTNKILNKSVSFETTEHNTLCEFEQNYCLYQGEALNVPIAC